MNTKSGITPELLTAYALGELDAVEMARVEARIAGDASACLQIDEVRATAQLLSGGWGSKAPPSFSPSSAVGSKHTRRRLLPAARGSSDPWRSRSGWRRVSSSCAGPSGCCSRLSI